MNINDSFWQNRQQESQLIMSFVLSRIQNTFRPVRDICRLDTRAEKFETLERTSSIRKTNGNLNSCNSCRRLGSSRLHDLHESKFSPVSCIEFIRSKLSIFLLMYPTDLCLRRHWRPTVMDRFRAPTVAVHAHMPRFTTRRAPAFLESQHELNTCHGPVAVKRVSSCFIRYSCDL